MSVGKGNGDHSCQIVSKVHSPQEIQIAHYSRKQAFEYLNKAYFGRALAHLFVALRLVPEWRNELRYVFCQALSGGCKQLADEGRLEDTINLRQEASSLYPDDEMILMDLGSIYFNLTHKETMSVVFDQMSMWYETLDSFVVGRKRRKDYRFFMVNLIAVNDGLRVGFLNDRHPFLSLKDSQMLVKTLQDKGLISPTVSVLNIGNREVVFVNTERLLEFVTRKQSSFKLVGDVNSRFCLVPHTSYILTKVETLISNCIKNYDTMSGLVLNPPDDISGSTFLGICLGYPVIYLINSNKSQLFENETLVVYELQTISKIPKFQKVQLFCFSVPQCIHDEVKQHIDSWHQTLLSSISDLRLDDIEKSLQYYCKALELCPSLLPASRAIQSIHNMQVERWHFRMLNDTDRNEAYNQAIAHQIQEGFSSVLDVGTGTGILSLFAARKNADPIWACESNPFMFRIAQSVLSANNLSGRVNLINKTSSSIFVPSDIPQRVSLLVTEIFDAGLFGEGVLPTLIHAWENLLLPPSCPLEEADSNINKAVVVPFSATVWVAAIQCIDIARRHRLLPSACTCKKTETSALCTKTIADSIAFGPLKLCKFCEAPLDKVHQEERDINCSLNNTVVVVNASEPYTTENLEHVPFGFELLSKPYKLLEINFNSLEELMAYSQNMLREKTISVLIDSAGSCDAIALWFHLNLDNNGTVLSTAPFSETGAYRGTCWHQAVFPSSIPKLVFPNNTIQLIVDMEEGVLDVSIGIDIPGESKGLFSISDYIVAFLNNKTWTRAFNAAAADFSKSACQNPFTSAKKILDLNPFPVFGLRMLKDCDPAWKLLAKAETNNDKEYILAVARENSVDGTQIEFVTDKTLEHVVRDQVFEFICLNVVDPSGEFVENLADTLPILQNKLSSTGKIIPNSLSIECQLIESESLIQESRVVSDENVGNFHIKDFINNFAVDYHLDVPYHSLKYKAFSEPYEVMKLEVSSSESNSICSEHNHELSISSIGEGTLTGIIYWVKLNLAPMVDSVSTICHDSHCNQVVLFHSLDVKICQVVNLECHFWYGMLHMKLSPS